MVSDKVIVRLQKSDWNIWCETEQQAYVVLQACAEADITCDYFGKAIGTPTSYPICIQFRTEDHCLNFADPCFFKGSGRSSKIFITDWFFDEIKKNDRKLIPQNRRESNLAQAILAMAQGFALEVYSKDENKWIDVSCSISIECHYRIKLTPLPIPRELWEFIDKDIRFCAMDEDGAVYFYEECPKLIEHAGEWNVTHITDDSYLAFPLHIKTQGIYWKTSLTERPEGV